ncbi:MAG: signal transduction histidine kinase [Cyclobacteriaceae bacterium]|jgi:signal transduction histidine kinase
MFRTVKESLPVDLKMAIEEGLGPEEQVSIVIYIVLQECLNNTLKYANASELQLLISKD